MSAASATLRSDERMFANTNHVTFRHALPRKYNSKEDEQQPDVAEVDLGTNPALSLLRPQTRGNPNEIFDIRRSNRCRHAWTGCVPKNRENGDGRATRSRTDSGSRSRSGGRSRSDSCSRSSGSCRRAGSGRSPWKIGQHRSRRSAAGARRSEEKLAVRELAIRD